MKRMAIAAAFTVVMAIASHGATNDAGLVLWNRLGSTNEIMQSAVGPGGTWTAGSFVPGLFGNAVELNLQQQFGCEFPIQALTTSVGCLEFWAKLSDFAGLPQGGGSMPGLIGYGVPGQSYGVLSFSSNDGSANGGLCATTSYGALGTGFYGMNWTYAMAMYGIASTENDISGWHHYALTWNGAGINSVGNGTRKVAVFVDGVLNSTRWDSASPASGLIANPSITRFGLLNHHGLTNGRVAFDNLKIWSFDKTDFADRYYEEGISNIMILADRASVSIPEGGTTNFQVKLSAQPIGDTVVAVDRTDGDADITITAGTNLVFTTNNWDVYQTVSLEATEDDADNSNGTASITCSGTGLTNATVEATEIDDDYTLTVSAVNGTVANDPNATFYDNGTEVTLSATEYAGYHFADWSGDASGIANPISVTMNADKSVTAAFALNVITVLTDTASVTVPEGSTSSFQVKLSAQPTGDTVVAVALSTGDTDITASKSASLTFSAANWAVYQSLSLSADEDNDDNQNGTGTITCSSPDIASAVVEATEADDDYTLTGTSLYGTIIPYPQAAYYDNGTEVALTAVPNPSYFFTEWTGGLADTNNPVAILMDSDKSVTASYRPTMLKVLPPSKIAQKSFTARWEWAEGGAPEGELSIVLDIDGFPQYVPGYWNRYVNNASECVITNLFSGKDYWYRVRRLMPDGSHSTWSSDVKVRTGKGMPAFKNLLSDGPVSKGISQQFALTTLISGTGTLKVKSSNTEAVNPVLTADTLTLQYLWKTTSSAKVTLTLTHPTTGYKESYGAVMSRAGGSVAVVGQSALTNAGTVAAQEVTLENQTGGMVFGVRVRAFGLDNQDWLLNRTGLDPVSKTAIMELPCVWPDGSQMVVRMVYNLAYKKQAKTRQVTYGAWTIMTPLSGTMPVSEDLTIAQQDLYDQLWLLGMPANRNRLYAVYHSDDGGDSWVKEAAVLRATGNYLMWMDTDESAPEGRLYRVVDQGM